LALGNGIAPEALLRLERLVTIVMHDWEKGLSDVDWRWLELLAERGRLEHLVVSHPDMPLELVCSVIGQCSVCLTF